MCNQLRAQTFCFYVWSTCTALEETWSHKRGPAETCFAFFHLPLLLIFHFSPIPWGKHIEKNMNKTWKTHYKTKQQTWTNIETIPFWFWEVWNLKSDDDQLGSWGRRSRRLLMAFASVRWHEKISIAGILMKRTGTYNVNPGLINP